MASAERASECSVCFEIFVNPKLLPCRHSYCEKCIHKLSKGSINLQCPQCKRWCDIDQVVHDFQTENFVQAFQELENEFNRRLVEATAASHAGPSTQPEYVVTAPMKCELCKDNEIAFWCIECEQWICSPCRKIHLNAKYAKDHHIQQLLTKNKEIESSLQTELQGLKVKIDEFHTYIRTLKIQTKNTQDTQLMTLKQSKELRDQCILEINNKFNQIDQDILEGTEHFLNLIERDIAKHQQIVCELEKQHHVLLATIKKKGPQLAINGANIVEQAKDLVRNTKRPDVYVTGITLKLQRSREWSAQAVSLEIEGGSIAPKSQSNVSSHFFGLVGTKNWKQKKSVGIPSGPRCLRNLGTYLYQCHNDGIAVYDMNLKQINNIAKGDMGVVLDVCDMPCGDLVIAACNALYQIKTNGKRMAQIADGNFTGVVCYNNRYYAVDTKTATVLVYEHMDGWKHCYSFSVNDEAGFIITLGITNNLLYVCLAKEDRIDIFSLDGQLKSSTGRKGNGSPGELSIPHIGATDAAGAALIADKWNNRLQLLSANRQWSVLQLQPRVEKPFGACLVNDTLYVNDWKEYSIHAYKAE